MEFSVVAVAEENLADVSAVMTRAFDDDARRHLGIEHKGPPGYDDSEFFRTWLFGREENTGGAVVVDGEIAGAFVVWPRHDAVLGTMFVDPSLQRRGVGSAMWRYIEETYPARTWTLHTPLWATSNHRFYKGCGFQRVEVVGDSVKFRKTV